MNDTMERTKTLRRRILILYVAFFAVVVAGISGSAVGQFTRGYDEGMKLSQRVVDNFTTDHPRTTQMLYALPNQNRDLNISIEGLSLPEGVSVAARINTLDLLVESEAEEGTSLLQALFSLNGSPATIMLSYVLLGCYIAIFIFILLIINSLRRSLKSESVFDRKNIVRTRAIGICIIVIALAHAAIQHLSVKAATALLDGSSVQLDTSLQLKYDNIVMGILILFIAEAFAIGYDMTQEQKFTI